MIAGLGGGAGCGRLEFVDVVLKEPPTLAYPARVHAVLSQTNLTLTPETTAGARPQSFTITPALPAGLTLNETTGEIVGVPTQVVKRVQYTVQARFTTGDERTPREASFWLTVLPGYEVTATADAPDDNAGADSVCFATAAGGCTLRAAMQSSGGLVTSRLILLDAATYLLNAPLTSENTVLIAGKDAASTIIRPPVVHPRYRMMGVGGGTLRLEDLTVQDFGVADGAAIRLEEGTFEAEACVFRNNEAESTGGVLFSSTRTSASFDECSFVGNRSVGNNGWGGVIDAEGAGAQVTVRRSSATGNLAVWGSFSHITTGATLVLENSTLYGNIATRAGTLASPGGRYILLNDTIVFNTNTFDDSAAIYLFSVPAEYTLTNTLVAFNTARSGKQNNCNRNDANTMIKSGGGNLFSDDSGNCLSFFGAADLLKTDPQLDPLGPRDHGGLTMTYAPAQTSPVLDAGVAMACPAQDQRGLPRPANGGCDIGAFELQ